MLQWMLLYIYICVCIYISDWFSFFSMQIPQSGTAWSWGSSTLNFLSNPHLLSTVATSIYIPTNSVWKFPFLHILASVCYFLSFRWWPFWQVWSNRLIVVLICISLIIGDIEHPFMCPLAMYMSLEKCL